MVSEIVTIGVYGFDEASFFKALQDAHVEVFCDIRRRRGMRGSLYAFANSNRLQERLRSLGIRYLQVKELAPDEAVRDAQRQEDKRLGVAKRERALLGHAFVKAYEEECLSRLDVNKFLGHIGPKARIVALFCVERNPDACHRSLVAGYLNRSLGIPIGNIVP